MPIKDPEKRREAQRAQKQAKRAAEKVERLVGKPVLDKLKTPSATKKPGVSARDFDLDKLTSKILMETNNLSQDGWLNLRGALGLEAVALARQALRKLENISAADALRLLKLGSEMVDQVIQAKGQLGGEDPLPSDEQELHAQMLADPVAREASQTLMQIHSQVLRQSEN